MPKRLSAKNREIYYDILVDRDGDMCRACGRSPETERGLTIHHLDAKVSNWSLSNLILLDRGCNTTESNRRRPLQRGRAATNTAPPVSIPGDLRESERATPSIDALKSEIEWSQASPEMRMGRAYETRWLSWLNAYVRQRGQIRVMDAISWGAQVVGCSVLTTARYMKKLGTPYDEYRRGLDANGDAVLTLGTTPPSQVPSNGLGDPDRFETEVE